VPLDGAITSSIGNISAATAAHDSARFPYVNGLGSIRCQQDDCSKFGTTPVKKGESRGHLADGGFFDGGGTATTLDVLAAIRAQENETTPRLPIRVIYIRNAQPLSTTCEPNDNIEPKKNCLVPTEKYVPIPPGTQANSDSLRLFADAFGPLVAVVNVSGIGSRGRHSDAELYQASVREDDSSPPVLLDQNNTGALVPLGWYLSPLAKAALDHQSARRASFICKTLDPQNPDCPKE